MQIMKKTLIILACCLFAISLVSCGSSNSSKEKEGENSQISDSDATEVDDAGETDADEENDGDDTDNENVETDADENEEDDSDSESAVADVTSIKFNVPEESSVVAEDSGHFAFPDVIRLESGKLMSVFRVGKNHAERSGFIAYSLSDDGINWSESDILVNDNTIDDRDPSIAVLSDGRVAMNWFKYRYPADYSEPWVHHLFFAVSDKSGLKFGDHIQVDGGVFDYSETAVMSDDGIWLDENGNEVTVAASSSSVIEHDGKIIIPGYFGNALNWQSMRKTPKTKIVLYESGDGGATWTPNEVEAEIEENTWLQEPALLKVTEERWIIQARTAKGSSPSNKGDLVQTVSEDGGKTWSPYKSLGFVAHAPELLKLENGVIISSFRWLEWEESKATSESVSMVYSLDGGDTWSDLIEILNCGAVECGYPGMIELPGNKILVVYYTPGGTGIDSKIITFEAE